MENDDAILENDNAILRNDNASLENDIILEYDIIFENVDQCYFG